MGEKDQVQKIEITGSCDQIQLRNEREAEDTQVQASKCLAILLTTSPKKISQKDVQVLK